MKSLFKKYIDLKENSKFQTHLKVELYYELGGMNYFTGRAEARGYYLSVSPVQRSGVFETYTGFTGVKHCLLPVSRQSKKAEKEALDLMSQYEETLIKTVCHKNKLQAV